MIRWPGEATDDQPTDVEPTGRRWPTQRRVGLLGLAAFTVAVAWRWPSCGESFWLDELHSAWAVWGDFGQVRQRAAFGNQTPIYFWGLWLWRAVMGQSEAALRASSVLLSSLSVGIVAAGVAWRGRTLLGGAVAGMLLATEVNAIFYGTELRVFAAVMLFASIACWGWLQWLQRPSGRALATCLSAIVGAALVQPTSLAVLAWLPLAMLGAAAWRGPATLPIQHRPSPMTILAGAVGLVLATIVFWGLAGSVLATAWQHRQQWEPIGSAPSPRLLRGIWPWTWTLVIPACLAGMMIGLSRILLRGSSADPQRCPERSGSRSWYWVMPAGVVILATLGVYLLAASGVVPMFHRRYMVAALPILGWAGGAAVGDAWNRLQQLTRVYSTEPEQVARRQAGNAAGGRLGEATWWPVSPKVTGGLFFVALLAMSPANPSSLSRPMLRTERWRQAVAQVRDEAGRDASVLLFPGLIEAPRLLARGRQAELAYLAYPLSGPYHIDHVDIISLRGPHGDLAARIRRGEVSHALLRCTPQMARRWLHTVIQSDPAGLPSYEVSRHGSVQLVSFGGV